MAATIKDIARALNISVSTVSYALNGGPRSVPDHVKESVHRVAKELGYRPNRLARSLITRRTHTIGIVPSTTHRDIVLSPFLQGALNGIVNEAEAQHHDVLIFTRCDQLEVSTLADQLLDGRVDCLIFVAIPSNSPLLDLVREYRIPYATISSANFDDVLQFSCDNAQGVGLAIEHLAGLGHTRIAHLSGIPLLQDSILREQAFRSEVTSRGLYCPEDWIREAGFVWHKGYDQAMQILGSEDRPTAIFCANDEIAFGVLRAAKSLGISVPEELSVVGFDDVTVAELVTPGLTTIRQPISELATLATRAVVEIVNGSIAGNGQTLPNRLVVRSSTAPPCRELIASS